MSPARKQKKKSTVIQQARSPVKEQKEKRSISQQTQRKSVNQLNYSLIITGIFFAVALFGLLHHEMWRDEYQAWLVARDAHSIAGVFKNMKYEGNPALWHIFIFFITRFSHNPVYMQAFHLLIACGFVFVFNRYAPIGMLYKILFTFGYFPLYEYAVISRSYGLGLLLLFIVCAIYKNRSSHYILLGVLLGLLANVTIYSAIISFGIAGILSLDYFFYQKKDNTTMLKLFAGASIFLILFIFSLYQVWPEKDNSFPGLFATSLFEPSRWGPVASKLFTTYFYIPDISEINFWNTNIYVSDTITIDKNIGQWLGNNATYLWSWVIMPVLLFISGVMIFLRKPLVALLYAGVTAALISVYYYTLLIHSRYCGHLLIILIVCYWLGDYYPEKKYNSAALNAFSWLGKKISKPLLAIILLFNIIGAVMAYSMDYNYKFSTGKEAANYIKENKLDTFTIVGNTDFILSPIASHLDRKLFYPEMNEFGSFTIWSNKRISNITFEQLIHSISSQVEAQKNKKLLLIETKLHQITKDGKNFYPLEHEMITPDIRLDILKKFDEENVAAENYYIYLVQKVDSVKKN